MRLEHYRKIRKGKPKSKGKHSGSKNRMLSAAKERKPITTPKLLEAYSTKTEWVRNVIPELKE